MVCHNTVSLTGSICNPNVPIAASDGWPGCKGIDGAIGLIGEGAVSKIVFGLLEKGNDIAPGKLLTPATLPTMISPVEGW